MLLHERALEGYMKGSSQGFRVLRRVSGDLGV